MPLIGNLSEFPLPEVMLLIGSRTGQLRLYDAAAFHPMQLDVSEGQAHGLHLQGNFLTDRAEIIAQLSFMVESGEGMFEFSAQSIIPVERAETLAINELVMLLVLHVDEKLARQRALLAPQLFYMLESTQPDLEINSHLNLFYLQSRQLLAGGVRAEDLAEYLGLEEELVRVSLDSLHQLGVVKPMETTDVQTLRETMVQSEISQKSTEFQLAVEASDLIRRTGKLLKLPSTR
jgi:hypothetical protein